MLETCPHGVFKFSIKLENTSNSSIVNTYGGRRFHYFANFLWVGNEPQLWSDASTFEVPADLYGVLMFSDGLQNVLQNFCSQCITSSVYRMSISWQYNHVLVSSRNVEKNNKQ